MTKIITTKGREIELDLSDPAVADWFARPQETMTDIIVNQINTEGLYNAVLADKNNLVIVDIGANIGLFSLYAQDSASRIIAVEPTPATLRILKRLVGTRIEIVEAALAFKDGTVDFYVHNNPTINSLTVNQSGECITVPAKTIKTILDELNVDHVDFVKCDIEGSEMLALDILRLREVADRVDSWFIEVHQTSRADEPWPGNLEKNRQILMQRLRGVGYQVQAIIHDQIFAYK